MVTLDVGCGCKKLHTPRSNYGIDLRSNPNGNPNYFACADAHKLPFMDETFEEVSFYEVIEFVENPASCLREIRRVLKPNGKLKMSCPNPAHWRIILRLLLNRRVSRNHLYTWNLWEITNLLTRCGFTVTCHSYVLVKERESFERWTHRYIDRLMHKLGFCSALTGRSIYIEAVKN